MLITDLHIEAIEAMGGSMEDLKKYLANNPDDTWEDYMDDLEFVREAKAAGRLFKFWGKETTQWT